MPHSQFLLKCKRLRVPSEEAHPKGVRSKSTRAQNVHLQRILSPGVKIQGLHRKVVRAPLTHPKGAHSHCVRPQVAHSKSGFLMVVALLSAVKAEASFFEKRAEGWHWYEDALRANDALKANDTLRANEIKKEDPEQPKSLSHPRSSLQKLTPTEEIEVQRKALEGQLHAAIINPTKENITAYLILQKALMDQSQRFAESWKEVVMRTPSLDETLVHPVDQNARHVYYAERNKDISKRIKALSQEYGLFFFFKETCAYCHQLSPLIKRFSQKHGWSVLPISMDGGTLPEFPDAKRDNGISKRLQIAHIPALVAIHPMTGKLIPLAYGLVSESEIEDRIELLTKIPVGAK